MYIDIFIFSSVSERTKRFDWQRCLLSFNFSSLAMVNVLHSQIGWQPSGRPRFVDEVPIQLLCFEGKSQHVVVSIKHNQFYITFQITVETTTYLVACRSFRMISPTIILGKWCYNFTATSLEWWELDSGNHRHSWPIYRDHGVIFGGSQPGNLRQEDANLASLLSSLKEMAAAAETSPSNRKHWEDPEVPKWEYHEYPSRHKKGFNTKMGLCLDDWGTPILGLQMKLITDV